MKAKYLKLLKFISEDGIYDYFVLRIKKQDYVFSNDGDYTRDVNDYKDPKEILSITATWEDTYVIFVSNFTIVHRV